jgi:methyl-accepting chemotaxis protein
MRAIHNIPIRRKLTLIIMIISTVTLMIASFAFLTSDRLYSQKNVGDSLGIMADMIAANSSAAILFGDPAAATETLGFLKMQDNIEAGVIYDINNEIFASYRKPGMKVRLPVPGAQSEDVLFRGGYVELFSDISYQGEKIGVVYLRSDMRAIHDRLFWFLGIVTAVLLVSLLVAYSLSAQMQHIITSPLFRLSAIARRISTEKNYSLRVGGEGRDELGNLILDFNTMLDEIQARDEKLKRHQEELEARVVQRTRELERANQNWLHRRNRRNRLQNACSSTPITTRSPACPTAYCSMTASRANSRMRAANSPSWHCCFSILTASRS